MLLSMSAVPGWYPDPAQPDRLRYWDGSGWTMQTSARAVVEDAASGFNRTQTAVLPRTMPRSSPHRQPAKPGPAGWLIVLGALVTAALAVGIAVLVSGGNSRKPSTAVTAPPAATTPTVAGCPNPLPASASPAAVAYVHALNMAAPGWAAVSAKLAAENRYPHLSDMAPEIAADGTFLTYLRQIHFPAGDVATATKLINAITAYRSLLTAAQQNWPLFDQQASQRQQVTDARSAASSQLRTLLGLPQAVCGYWRP